MFSVAVTKPGKIELVEVPKPEIGNYSVLVKNKVATLCNSTDNKLIRGNFPGVENYPLLLGHETAGIVVEIGNEVKNFSIGDAVVGSLLLNPSNNKYNSGWGGFSEYTVIRDHEAMTEAGVADKEHGWSEVNKIQLPVKEDIPIEAAVLLCTWREVYSALEDFNIRNNKDINNILIFGGGPVGLSFLKLLKLEEKNFVGLIDPHEYKRNRAINMGADRIYKPDDDLLIHIKNDLGFKLDATIDAAGYEKIINQSLSLIRMNGKICVYGVIDKSELKLTKELAPYNFNLLFHQWPTRELESAAHNPLIKLIQKGSLKHENFITAEFPINEINNAIKATKKNNNLKILLRFD